LRRVLIGEWVLRLVSDLFVLRRIGCFLAFAEVASAMIGSTILFAANYLSTICFPAIRILAAIAQTTALSILHDSISRGSVLSSE
jgi:hypothetical protein